MVRAQCKKNFIKGSVVYWTQGNCYEIMDREHDGWRIKNDYGSETWMPNEEFKNYFEFVVKGFEPAAKIRITSQNGDVYIVETPRSILVNTTYDVLDSWVNDNIKNFKSWEVVV